MFSPGSLQSPQALVKAAFADATKKAFEGIDHDPVVTQSNPKFGDYQCNSAMALFKEHKSTLNVANPKAVGERLKETLSDEIFAEAVVAPQGFVTIKMKDSWLADQLRPFIKKDFSCKAIESKKCLIDYSSPNIAKEMHVGHLRSTIIGELIARILEFVGHSVDRVNHLGDWGTQFGMLIQYMREVYPDFQTNPPNLSDLCGFYRESKKRFDEDPEFKKNAQQNVVALQAGEPFAREAWKLFCDISRKDFQQIYDRLDITLEDFGESFYNEMIPGVVKDLEGRGLIVESLGAKCFFVEDDPSKREKEVPLMAVKSDGGYGYDSTDLAAIHYRLITLGRNWLIYVTDLGQESHFMKIFKAAQIAGWHKPPQTRVEHVGFGVVQGEDGKKFKTRSGDLVKLSELLDEAVGYALKEITRRRQGGNGADEDEEPSSAADEEGYLPAAEAAAKIGYSAVKYFDLKQNRLTNYKFSYDKMLDPRGNTAVYLLYAYARICAIFRKAGVKPSDINPSELKIVEPEERSLALILLRFPEVISAILDDMGIHRLAELMYDISTQFTAFYQKCKVVGSPEQNSRLLLCELTRKMLQTCFSLMGIQALERI